MTHQTEFKMSDPGLYDPLISDQKAMANQSRSDPRPWVELGLLQEEKARLTHIFVKKSRMIRWIPISSILLCCGSMAAFFILMPNGVSTSTPLVLCIFAICLLILSGIFRLRYPRSGRRYFRRALQLDPGNAQALMHLGFIALRRHRRKKAARFLEQALRLSKDKKLERRLKTLYEKEILRFLHARIREEERLSTTISSLNSQVASLKSEIIALKRQNSAITDTARKTRTETSYKLRQAKKELKHRVDRLQTDYEIQIAELEQAMMEEETQKEAARKKMVGLTLEIMESKARAKQHLFDQAACRLETQMGPDRWKGLTRQTRSFLATAEHAFSVMDRASDRTDFSLIGMELCKALETEINLKLVQPFITALGDDTGTFLAANLTGYAKGLPAYYSMLARVADKVHYPDTTTLTLGQYLFVLRKTLEGDYTLDAYGNYIEHLQAGSDAVIGRRFLQKLKTVTQDYRNAIVHHAPMTLDSCHTLRRLIFLEPDALLVICSRLPGPGD